MDLRGAPPWSRLDRLSVGEAIWSRFMSLLGLWAKTPEERGVAAGDWALPLAETPAGDFAPFGDLMPLSSSEPWLLWPGLSFSSAFLRAAGIVVVVVSELCPDCVWRDYQSAGLGKPTEWRVGM